MNKFFYYFSIVIIFLAIMLGIYAIYLMVYPFKTIVDKQPSQVLTPTVKAGGILIVVKNYCKYTDINATLVRNLVDDISIPLPVAESTLNKGCGVKNVVIPIPDYVPAGTYYLKTTSIYKINALRTISYDSKTVEFNIIGK
jgi:hypothetical protein